MAFAPVAFWLMLPNVAMAGWFVLGLTCALWLTGPVVSVTVTRQEVVVRNTFHTWRIGRSLISRSDDIDDTELRIAGHPAVDVSAFDKFYSPRITGSHKPATPGTGWFGTTLAEVPALPDDGRRRLGPHWSNLLLALIAVAGFVEAWRLAPQ
ncbi:hypothetical protein Aab01nite_52530 [Paractinoplanes abujensis]|nr:hypothetical protein Aab01nite_52530 [Actinoplanes abujensis]